MNPSLIKKEIHPGGILKSAMTENDEAILKVLSYFDIFHYPLKQDEIRQFLSIPLTDDLVKKSLHRLQLRKLIFVIQEYYSLQDNPLLVYRRINGNQKAEKLLKKANKIGQFLYHFPFVRAVAISGSLSKNFAGEKADIDFFIITKASRVWIARTLMHLFKKLTFITGHQHLFCMNYYIDEKNLCINEKNIFTAIEIKTLMPVNGEKTITEFFSRNDWSHEWLPNCDFYTQPQKDTGPLWFKKFSEWILKGQAGQLLENLFYKITCKRWSKKILKGQRNCKGIRMSLVTDRHFAKSNPDDFQEKVLSAFREKLYSFGIESA